MMQVLSPDGTRSQARSLARQSMRNYCKTLVDFLRLPKFDVKDTERLVSFDRWDLFDKALAPGKGTVFATLHMGSWDVGGAVMGQKGYRFSVIVDVFQDRSLNDKVVQIRREKGFNLVPAGRVPKTAMSALRKGQLLGVLIDKPVTDGVTVQFFGAPATLPGGAAVLALRTGASVLPGCLLRNPDGTMSGVVDEPIFPEPTGNWDEDVRVLTQQIMTALEAKIRMDPGQWYMFRPMWPKHVTSQSRQVQEDRGMLLDQC